MKNTIMVLALLCLAVSLSGQIQIGVKTFYSMNYAGEQAKEYVNTAPVQVNTIAFKSASPKSGIGLSIYNENARVFAMADATYSKSSRTFALQSTSFRKTPLDPEVSYETNETDIRLTANAGIKLKNFKLGVGPEVSLGIDRTETLSEMQEVSNTGSKYNTGFNFLIGYEFPGKIHIDIKHTYIFQDVSNEFKYDGVPMDLKTNAKYLELSLAKYF